MLLVLILFEYGFSLRKTTVWDWGERWMNLEWNYVKRAALPFAVCAHKNCFRNIFSIHRNSMIESLRLSCNTFWIFCKPTFFRAMWSNNFIYFLFRRMSHHHYQQRLSHQQVQQQVHGNRSLVGSLNHPPPIIPKQHLHQNIATLNQKPPHVTNHQFSQNPHVQRISYDSKL